MRSLFYRWPFILSIVLVTLALGACGGGAAQREAPATPPPAAGARQAAPDGGAVVNVVSKDFAFSLDAARINAGPTTFVLRNDGPAPHDFAIRGNGVDQKTPIIQQGKSASLTVGLKPGPYTYICTIPGHDHLGMQGTFTVG
jgi:plastocyanin